MDGLFLGPTPTNPTARITQDALGAHHGVMGSDPGSIDGHTFGVDKQDPQQGAKGKAQWSEHVWSELKLLFIKDTNTFS